MVGRPVSYDVFAWRRDDEDGTHDLHRRGLPAERLTDALTWALGKGCDGVLVELSDTPAFQPSVAHHVCDDPACPGGC